MVGLCGSLVIANVVCQLVYTVNACVYSFNFPSRILTHSSVFYRIRLGVFAKLHELFQLSRSVNILSAASDIAIAGCLIFLLQSSRTGFNRSDSIINRLIMFSMNTGLLTSLDAIASLIFVTVFPNNFIYIMFFITGCKRMFSIPPPLESELTFIRCT